MFFYYNIDYYTMNFQINPTIQAIYEMAKEKPLDIYKDSDKTKFDIKKLIKEWRNFRKEFEKCKQKDCKNNSLQLDYFDTPKRKSKKNCFKLYSLPQYQKIYGDNPNKPYDYIKLRIGHLLCVDENISKSKLLKEIQFFINDKLLGNDEESELINFVNDI